MSSVAVVRVERKVEIEMGGGPYNPFAPGTFGLGTTARWWMRFRKLRVGTGLAGLPDVDIHAIKQVEGRYNRRASSALDDHVLGPWLADLPGLGGAMTAYLVGSIRDPWRFPGQRCAEGHYVRPEFEEGEPCPIEDAAESDDRPGRCGAPLLSPRPGTGVRALWHYCGLAPGCRKQKGQQATWVPELKGLLLAPDTGLAAQIVRHRPEPYRTTYDDEKARLMRERGYRSEGEGVRADAVVEIDDPPGPADLPPLIRLERIARVIAVKAFVGDLLMEWKRRQPLGSY